MTATQLAESQSSTPVQQVAVIGGGLMGSGIAEVVAISGIPVVLRDVDDAAIEAARARIETSLARAVRSGKAAADEADAAIERVRFTTGLDAVTDADLIIEAVPEDEELKVAVLADLGAIVGTDVVIASNTSSIPIAQLAAAVPNPERVIGLHFFSPVPMMNLVEVVVALDTSDATLERAKAFVQQIGKVAIETKDRSGFIVNMLLVPYLMAAVRMYEEGFASREAIDDGMKLGCGHPMGPLALCDLIGLDVLYSVCGSLYEEFKQPAYAPPPLIKRMVASGRLGRKAGRGFYEYRSDA
jgi:3-hydroxybutyryl-CoA dehydrogenase